MKTLKTAAQPKKAVLRRVRTALEIANGLRRVRALRKLMDRAPTAVLETIVALLRDADPTLRRRAGGALVLFSPLRRRGVTVEQRADALADYLVQGEDARVRLSCAIVLMAVHGPVVDRAYLRALRDSSEQIAELACLEIGDRAPTGGTAALVGMLTHASWQVRLQACKALITQKKAAARVVSTLEALRRAPEAAVYDKEMDESKDLLEALTKACVPEGKSVENWGKLDTILARARALVHPTELTAKPRRLKP